MFSKKVTLLIVVVTMLSLTAACVAQPMTAPATVVETVVVEKEVEKIVEVPAEAEGAGGLTDVDRLISPNYRLPDNWEEMVDGTTKISHFNYGALDFDPATVRNGDTFEDLTGVEVEHIVVAFEDMSQKISTALLSESSTPDMFQIERHYVQLAKAGMLVNLDELWTDELWENYADWVKDDVEVDGHYYAVPQLGQQWGFYYRPAVLEEAGYSAPPTTKDELVEMAQALTTDDMYGYGFAAGDSFSAYESFLSILYMMDGRLLQEDGKINVQTPEAEEALQFLVDLVYEYEVAPPSAAELKESELGDMFVGGNLAMMGQWDYHFNRAKDPEVSNIAEDVGFTVPPSWDAETEGKGLGDYEILAINKFSENIEASKLFLDYMRSEQAHTNEFLLEGNNTLVKAVYDRAAAATELDPEYLEAHLQLADRSIRENFSEMDKVVDDLGSQIQAAVAGAKTPQEALADAQAAIDKSMGY
jgi:multiple sugar transport system substrate-binding protein